jgi:hypothetical protein
LSWTDLAEGILQEFVDACVGAAPEIFKFNGFRIVQSSAHRNRNREYRPVDVDAKRRLAFTQLCEGSPRQPPPKPSVTKYQREKARIQALRAARSAA